MKDRKQKALMSSTRTKSWKTTEDKSGLTQYPYLKSYNHETFASVNTERFTTRFKTLMAFKKIRFSDQTLSENIRQHFPFFGIRLFGHMKPKETYLNASERWKDKSIEKSRNRSQCVKHGGGSMMLWALMAANGTASLAFVDHMTADRKQN